MLHDVVMWRAPFRATRVRRRPRWQMDRIGELDESQKLQKDLYEMELERINFMLRNYLRDRLRKVRRQRTRWLQRPRVQPHVVSHH